MRTCEHCGQPFESDVERDACWKCEAVEANEKRLANYFFGKANMKALASYFSTRCGNFVQNKSRR